MLLTEREPTTRILGHAPALDGLRGLAVALIVVFHFAGHYVLHGATASLDVFFALSGFLITTLVLDERRATGRVDLRAFYVRRACRLLPALFAMLAVWSLLLVFCHDQGWMGSTPAGDGSATAVPMVPALKDVGLALLYLANWDVISGGTAAPLQHLWSLAVEEQFYIVWPSALLLLLLLRRRVRVGLLATAIGCSMALSAVLWERGSGANRIYFGTDTRAASLLIGALGALLWHRRRAQGRRTARWAAPRAWLGAAVFAVVLAELHEDVWKYAVLPAVVALSITQVMPYVVDSPRTLLARALSLRWLVWLGQRSYGLYLWHYLWATWTHGLPLGVGIPLGVGGALLCTVVSWRFIERPVIAWGRARVRQVPAPHPLPRPVPVRVAA
ncbi:MAG: acyltransferase family protein [Mycobacteriales bacterium]